MIINLSFVAVAKTAETLSSPIYISTEKISFAFVISNKSSGVDTYAFSEPYIPVSGKKGSILDGFIPFDNSIASFLYLFCNSFLLKRLPFFYV